MSLRTTRLTYAEWLAGLGSVLLLVDLFGLSWFAYGSRYHAFATMLGQSASANGWSAFTVVGPLTLVVCTAGVGATVATAFGSSPAVPVVITTLLLPVSLVQSVLVAIKVVLDAPSVHLVQAGGANVIETRPGAYLGLVLSLGVFAGVYLSLRREGVGREDAPTRIELIGLPTDSAGTIGSRG
jgi:hypothetical protein